VSLYYEDDHVRLYHGDCLTEHREWLEADVLVTDPPYGRNWQSGSGMTNSHGRGRGSIAHGGIMNDKDTAARDAALAAWGDRLATVFGDPLIQQPAGAVQVLPYIKPLDAGIKGARAGRRRDLENIYLVGPWPVGVGGKSSVITTNGLVAGPRGVATRAGHPHAKPQDVMQELVRMAADVTGDAWVADPFAGSGSTLVATKALGLHAIGVELDERYCEIAAKRLAQEVLPF
jgi:site-specific DNA-methyltransferase (adenine-specific)